MSAGGSLSAKSMLTLILTAKNVYCDEPNSNVLSDILINCPLKQDYSIMMVQVESSTLSDLGGVRTHDLRIDSAAL